MAHYMIQASYTPEAWATQIKNPQNLVDRLRGAIEGLGGKIVGGSVKSTKTTPLLTLQEGMDAMNKAGGSSYEPPS